MNLDFLYDSVSYVPPPSIPLRILERAFATSWAQAVTERGLQVEEIPSTRFEIGGFEFLPIPVPREAVLEYKRGATCNGFPDQWTGIERRGFFR